MDKKAEEISILDLRGISSITDYFVICSASSSRQAKAIADGIMEKLSSRGIRSGHKEGYQEALWILLDYGGVIAHIFSPETRSFYGLERLWGDAPQVAFKQ